MTKKQVQLYLSKCDLPIPGPAQNSPQLCSWNMRDQSLETSWAAVSFAGVVSSRMTSQKSRDNIMTYLLQFEQLWDGGIFPRSEWCVYKFGLNETLNVCRFYSIFNKLDLDQF